MKILFNTHYHAFQNPGGGEVVLDKTMEALLAKGIDVVKFDQWKTKICQFDILHDFSSLSWRNWEGYKKYGVKLVVTPVMWPNTTFLKPQREFAKAGLKNLIGVKSPEVNMWNAMRLPDLFCPTSKMEMDRIMKFFYLRDSAKFKVIHNGLSVKSVEKNRRNSFVEKFGVEDYFLFVGRLSPLKNVHRIIEATLAEGKNLVVIGDADLIDLSYAGNLKNRYSDKVTFIPHLPHQSDLLFDAFRGAKALIVASLFETCSLVGMEAGALGTPVIMTESGATKEIYSDFVHYVKPLDVYTIQEAIKKVCSETPSDKLRNHIIANYSWDRVADDLINAYSKVLTGACDNVLTKKRT